MVWLFTKEGQYGGLLWRCKETITIAQCTVAVPVFNCVYSLFQRTAELQCFCHVKVLSSCHCSRVIARQQSVRRAPVLPRPGRCSRWDRPLQGTWLLAAAAAGHTLSNPDSHGRSAVGRQQGRSLAGVTRAFDAPTQPLLIVHGDRSGGPGGRYTRLPPPRLPRLPSVPAGASLQ